jgi:hypothetical protein
MLLLLLICYAVDRTINEKSWRPFVRSCVHWYDVDYILQFGQQYIDEWQGTERGWLKTEMYYIAE